MMHPFFFNPQSHGFWWKQRPRKLGTTLVWVPLIIEHLNAITDCKFGRHDTEHYNK